MLIMDRETKVSTVTLRFDLPLIAKVHAKCHIMSVIGHMHEPKNMHNFCWFILLLRKYLYQFVYLLGLNVTPHDGGTGRPGSDLSPVLVLSAFFLWQHCNWF